MRTARTQSLDTPVSPRAKLPTGLAPKPWSVGLYSVHEQLSAECDAFIRSERARLRERAKRPARFLADPLVRRAMAV